MPSPSLVLCLSAAIDFEESDDLRVPAVGTITGPTRSASTS